MAYTNSNSRNAPLAPTFKFHASLSFANLTFVSDIEIFSLNGTTFAEGLHETNLGFHPLFLFENTISFYFWQAFQMNVIFNQHKRSTQYKMN